MKECSDDLVKVFNKYKVPLKKFRINRLGNEEEVYVAAIKEKEAMYYEDIEEGWNFSEFEGNQLLNHFCNQDPLSYALRNWCKGS